MSLVRKLLTLSVATGFAVPAAVFAAEPLPYPDGYRSWHHVKSAVLQQGHPLFETFGGIHHVYANPAAVTGLRSGTYADGATLVFDLLEAVAADAAVGEGDRKLVGLMVKDRERFAATGGWGFEGFAGDSRDQRLVSDGGVSCYGCHTQKRDSDFVFSELRD